LLDNCMPMGDVSTVVEGTQESYSVCPLSSIGALTIVKSLDKLTMRELVARGHKHQVLQNMHLGQTQVNYDAWLADQRRRYSSAVKSRSFGANPLNLRSQMTKTYLITGASGIGAETAKQLAQAGHGPDSVQLFIAAREEDKCKIRNCACWELLSNIDQAI
jgi:hypothetical protein